MSGTWRESRRNGPEVMGEGSFGVYREVERSVRSNQSFEQYRSALKPPDWKFRVVFGGRSWPVGASSR